MRKGATRKILIGAFWLFLIANSSYWIGKRAFDAGVMQGRGRLVAELNQPELRISHLGRDETRLVVIEQRMEQGNLERQRVEIDTGTIVGLEAERLGSLGSGAYGSIDEVSVWRIVNSSGRDLQLTEKEFTNLPDAFRLVKNFDGDFTIPTNKQATSRKPQMARPRQPSD